MYLDAVKFKIREQIKIFNQSLCMLILKEISSSSHCREKLFSFLFIICTF